MHRRPFILHVCWRDHPPSLVDAVLARAGFGVLPATSTDSAMSQLSCADAIVICACWQAEEKHSLIVALRERSSAPVICINNNSHACSACTQADRYHPEELVAIIRGKLAKRRLPNTAVVHPLRVLCPTDVA